MANALTVLAIPPRQPGCPRLQATVANGFVFCWSAPEIDPACIDSHGRNLGYKPVYKVQISASLWGWTTVDEENRSTQCMCNDLVPGKRYVARVQAVTPAGRSSWSKTSEYMTAGAADYDDSTVSASAASATRTPPSTSEVAAARTRLLRQLEAARAARARGQQQQQAAVAAGAAGAGDDDLLGSVQRVGGRSQARIRMASSSAGGGGGAGAGVGAGAGAGASADSSADDVDHTSTIPNFLTFLGTSDSDADSEGEQQRQQPPPAPAPAPVPAPAPAASSRPLSASSMALLKLAYPMDGNTTASSNTVRRPPSLPPPSTEADSATPPAASAPEQHHIKFQVPDLEPPNNPPTSTSTAAPSRQASAPAAPTTGPRSSLVLRMTERALQRETQRRVAVETTMARWQAQPDVVQSMDIVQLTALEADLAAALQRVTARKAALSGSSSHHHHTPATAPATATATAPATAIGDDSCVVCHSQPRTVLLMPCRHLALCSTCDQGQAAALAACPLCSKTIQHRLQVFTT